MQTKLKNIKTTIVAILLCFTFVSQAIPGPILHPISKAKKAPDLLLKDLEGKTHNISDYHGKVVLVNFWATWCPPCRDEMPSMQRVWDKLKDKGFVILAVDVGEDAENIIPFIMEHDIEFPILLDKSDKTARAWRVRGMPTSFLVDKQGNIVYQALGGREWDDAKIVEIIQGLITNR
ncbi:MAG: TlpA family protein disulfide reductase [Magnetococcales bacterium]|nr:TlpA family protein disulfide reductase [Magnetococcales bacterium]